MRSSLNARSRHCPLWLRTYMLFYVAYSLVNISYGSLASARTQLPDERAELSSARSLGTATAIIGLTIVVAPQINRAAELQRSLTITTLSPSSASRSTCCCSRYPGRPSSVTPRR
jgi:Na+/melibiose symporter-like transporter